MPPYADNLYSADDSDDESFSEELSPTDGYFNHRDQSPNVLIPDPSITSSSTAESKAREAREESEALARSTTGSHQLPSSTTKPPLPQLPPSPQVTVPSPSNVNASTTIYTSSSPSRYTLGSPISPQRTHHQDLYSESSPLLYSTAPPAYSPSSNPSQGHQRNYSTIASVPSQAHLEEGRFFPSREPESMGQPIEEREPLSRRPVISRTRRFVQQFILFLSFLAVAASLITAVTKSSTTPNHGAFKPNDPMEQEGSPYCISATNVLWNTNFSYNFNEPKTLTVIQSTNNERYYPDGVSVRTVGEIHIRRLPENSPYTKGYFTSDVRASDPSISVEQQLVDRENTWKIISPQSVPRTPENSRERPCISIQMILWVPDGIKLNNLIVKAVTLSIKMFPGIKAHVIDETHIKTISGSIEFLSATTGTKTKVKAKTQNLDFGLPRMPKKSWWLPDIPFLRPKLPFMDDPKEEPENSPPPGLFPLPDVPEWSSEEEALKIFTSRRQYIETISGSIRGTYTLYDYLHVTSQSGSINVNILPQEEDKDAPAPAELYMHSSSGSVHGYFPFHSLTSSSTSKSTIPIREYKTHVESTSGTLQGRFLLGVHSYFKSMSGGIQLEVLNAFSKPSKESEGKIYFSTETISGSTRVHLLNSHSVRSSDSTSPFPSQSEIETAKNSEIINAAREALRNVSSTHKGHSGSINLSYPKEWEGSIVAQAMSGSLQVRGKGVVIDGRRDWVPKEVRAHKGDDDENGSSLVVNEISGSVDIWIGD